MRSWLGKAEEDMIVASGAKTSSKESNGLNRLAAVWKRDTEDNFQDEYYYRVTNTTGSEMILDMVTTPSGDSSIADNSNVEKSVPLKLSAKSVWKGQNYGESLCG
jgi:hypothetical protein